MVSVDRYPEVCPHTIKRTPMRMKWDDLTMLHWRYEPEEVQELLPEGLTVETFDGSAWVGLVPFQMRIDVPFAPAMKSILHFPETNVRTYVTSKSNEPGVYFWSLEASSLPAVVTARTSYQVPYFWADMTIDRTDAEGREIDRPLVEGDRIAYATARRWPDPRPATSLVSVTVGEAFTDGQQGPLDRFLTARWALYGDLWKWRSYAKMYHEPWPLHFATADSYDDELITATGLAQPEGEPVVHFSPGVNVRCGWPQKG